MHQINIFQIHIYIYILSINNVGWIKLFDLKILSNKQTQSNTSFKKSLESNPTHQPIKNNSRHIPLAQFYPKM